MCFIIIGIVMLIGGIWNYTKFSNSTPAIVAVGFQGTLAMICFACAFATIVDPLILSARRNKAMENPNIAQIQAFNLKLGAEQTSPIAHPAWYLNYNKLMSLEPIEEKDYDIQSRE